MLLTILNQQRHDWLNHFQVLLGYLRLGRPAEGEAYLQRVTEQTHQESNIARIQCPPLSVFFLTFHALHHDFRLEVEIYNDVNLSTLPISQMDLYHFITQVIYTIKKYIHSEDVELPNLLISLESKEEGVVFHFDLAMNVTASAKPEMEKLLESGKATGFTIVHNTYEEDEWVLELLVPYRT